MRLFDIKTNIIPRVDPNCESISESLSFLKEFKDKDIEKICSAPNFFDVGNNQIEDIIIEIQKEASKIEDFEIPIIYNSIVYPINIDIVNLEKINSINNSRFFFCRFPSYGVPSNYLEKLKYAVNNNYIPILTNVYNSPISRKIKNLNDLLEIGCFFDVDLNNFVKFNNKKSIKIIKYMEHKNSILTISGFSKMQDLENNFEKFSKKTKIDLDKIQNIYCWSNPNMIIFS
tara:strand:- start:2252 stop:2941 length:690 start_codon:yes stop_codon:yes gene_type:complete